MEPMEPMTLPASYLPVESGGGAVGVGKGKIVHTQESHKEILCVCTQESHKNICFYVICIKDI